MIYDNLWWCLLRIKYCWVDTIRLKEKKDQHNRLLLHSPARPPLKSDAWANGRWCSTMKNIPTKFTNKKRQKTSSKLPHQTPNISHFPNGPVTPPRAPHRPNRRVSAAARPGRDLRLPRRAPPEGSQSGRQRNEVHMTSLTAAMCCSLSDDKKKSHSCGCPKIKKQETQKMQKEKKNCKPENSKKVCRLKKKTPNTEPLSPGCAASKTSKSKVLRSGWCLQR